MLASFLAASVFSFLGCAVMARNVYSRSFDRVEESPEKEFSTYITWNEIDQTAYSREVVYFDSMQNKSGANKLQGFIYGSSNDKGLVVISHGLGANADSYFPMIMFFVDNGWRVFAYNNTGTAGSEGESTRGLTQSVVDLDAALNYIKTTNNLSSLPIMLVGHSWGGYAVTAVLNNNHDINAVASFAGFNNGVDLFRRNGVASVGPRYYMLHLHFKAIHKRLFGNFANYTAVDGINKANIPVMIVQSEDDDLILANVTSIYAYREKITNPNVEIIYLEGEDASGHIYVFCSKEQREYMTEANASWELYKRENENTQKSEQELRQAWAQDFNFDKLKANELNLYLMQRVNTMFSYALN
jgi:pimeloyl-ACP methyl ester carboxylesterase